MLDLIGIARKVTVQGWELAGQIVVAHTYTQAANPQYNTTTGAVTPNNTTATVNAIVSNYHFKEVDGQVIRFGDEKVFVQIAEMGGIVPNPDDYMTAGSVRRNILNIQRDPTGTLFIFQTRKAQA